MSAHPIVVTTEDGREERFPSLNSAVPHLNISTTTIRLYARTGEKIQTRLGIVGIRFEDSGQSKEQP